MWRVALAGPTRQRANGECQLQCRQERADVADHRTDEYSTKQRTEKINKNVAYLSPELKHLYNSSLFQDNKEIGSEADKYCKYRKDCYSSSVRDFQGGDPMKWCNRTS